MAGRLFSDHGVGDTDKIILDSNNNTEPNIIILNTVVSVSIKIPHQVCLIH